MGSFNCAGFHSRLPITSGDDIFVILGLCMTPKCLGNYAFDPMTFAPGVEFTPIALPIFCKYNDCRHIYNVIRDRNVDALELFFGMKIEDVLNLCDSDSDKASKMAKLVNETFGLASGEYLLTFSFDHRFIYDEISSMKLPWDWKTSYKMTLEHSDITAGKEILKYSDTDRRLLEIAETLPEGEEKNKLIEIILQGNYSASQFDAPFRTHTQRSGAGHSVANLNPKYVGTSLFQNNEAFSGELLLAVYRSHADILFELELKDSLINFMNFFMALRYHNWQLTLPVYSGQEERYAEIAPLYRRMAEWVEKMA